jgi:hypothetical protein
MLTDPERSREPRTGNVKPSPVTAMGPKCDEWAAWTSEVKFAYLRGYCEAELFYRGIIWLQWKGNFGPGIDRAISHLGYKWPCPSRSFAEEYEAMVRFYEDPKNEHIAPCAARRCVLMQIAGYPPSVIQETMLKVRTRSFEKVGLRDRILPERWPSLAELEKRSSTRALDENESWILVQLTAREKGPDAALPLLSTFLEAHPVHDGALFLRGRLLLDKNDPAGVVDLERFVELEPDSLAVAHELIAAFHYRQHDADTAETFAALARRWRTIEQIAESERVSIENGDELIPHELSDDVLTVLRDQLRRLPEIATCYLARKMVQVFVDQHFYLLGVAIDSVQPDNNAERRSTDLIVKIKTQIVLPEQTYVVVFDESTRALQDKVRALPSARFYTRKKGGEGGQPEP